ncbi:MAG: hypothetical protein ACI9LT_000676 [Pseudoalteromonas distincta]|jgi:hypothetical protein
MVRDLAINDWLRIEFGIEKPGRARERPHRLDIDGLAGAVRATLPRRRGLSAAEVAPLRQEYVVTIEQSCAAAARTASLELQMSDLVNSACGLTPKDMRLMCVTAPPRMPLVPNDVANLALNQHFQFQKGGGLESMRRFIGDRRSSDSVDELALHPVARFLRERFV